MAKAYHLKEIIDLDSDRVDGQPSLTSFSDDSMSEFVTKNLNSAAGEKFLNEAGGVEKRIGDGDVGRKPI